MHLKKKTFLNIMFQYCGFYFYFNDIILFRKTPNKIFKINSVSRMSDNHKKETNIHIPYIYYL